MIIPPESLTFLAGEDFSNGFTFRIPENKILPLSREEAIINTVKGKNVIHMGCADHLEVIPGKIESGKWLHALITDNCNETIGIDINSEAIDYIKSKLGYSNVILADISEETPEILKSKNWDWVVFGEILEHIDNPVLFLRNFRENYKNSVSRFLITVPSVYNTVNFMNMMSFKEVINSDHRYWFTPYTVCKVLTEAGLKPEEISFANLKSLSLRELAIRKLLRLFGRTKLYPFYCFNTMIITGSL
jgi:hypothetical protein